jgi:hypothetical protein
MTHLISQNMQIYPGDPSPKFGMPQVIFFHVMEMSFTSRRTAFDCFECSRVSESRRAYVSLSFSTLSFWACAKTSEQFQTPVWLFLSCPFRCRLWHAPPLYYISIRPMKSKIWLAFLCNSSRVITAFIL